MIVVRRVVGTLPAVLFVLAVAVPAHAQVSRSWVSGVGDDLNPCSRTAPCKTYAGAISKTARGGEISTLDPGGFGAVTITKSITISGGGNGAGYGSILASLTTGIIVNITDPADTAATVRIDGLNINGVGTGIDGIRVISAKTVQIENTTIDGFTQQGIDVSTTSALTFVTLKNVTIRNAAGGGVSLLASGANQNAFAFDGVNISRCGNVGFQAQNGSRGSIRNSMFAFNGTSGMTLTEVGSDTSVNIEGTTVTGHTNGITVNSGTNARIAHCLIAQNANSFSTVGGLIDTGGNNTIMGNTNNVPPNGTLFDEN